MNETDDKIKKLKLQIEQLPKGTLVYKNIQGKRQPYLQQTINGKSKSTYIKTIDRELILNQIDERNKLIKELKKYQSDNYYANIKENINSFLFKNEIRLSEQLISFSSTVKDYKKRNCYSLLNDYLYNDEYSKVFILYGLRRTGKTTLIKQAIDNMSSEDLNKTAFIQVGTTNTLSDLSHDLKLLEKSGYKYIFIDEVTLINDFIDGAAFLPDIFVASGMKIVLSGTDSLGFWLSQDEQLYDRVIIAHTTFIPYYEFEKVLGIKGIDNYINFGGTMCTSGNHYNNLFENQKSIDEYIDSSIAKNIQHSLRCYQEKNHFRNLEDLYEKNELTSVINRVVEDVNHKFTIEVLTRDFYSHDLNISSRNLRNDKNNPNDILEKIDQKEIIKKLKLALDILNKEEQKIKINEQHEIEIKEYLFALDLINYVDLKFIPSNNDSKKITIVSQPGLRYSQAKILIEKLLMDKVFNNISALERKNICERILNEVKGRIMEEIVLFETSIVKRKNDVFKLQFARGEFDMVVVDKENTTCEIYEINHSDEIVEDQYKHLIDKEKCESTEFRYGRITNKCVLYRGKNIILDNGISYLNVEDYLKNLYK